MKKILKSELTPQLVKHQEAIQLLNVQRGNFSPVLSSAASVPELQTLTLSSDHEN